MRSNVNGLFGVRNITVVNGRWRSHVFTSLLVKYYDDLDVYFCVTIVDLENVMDNRMKNFDHLH